MTNKITDEITKKECDLLVYEKITFDDQPKHYVAVMGENQTIICDAKFDSDVKNYSINWHYPTQFDSRVIRGPITANTHYSIDNIEIKNHVITSKLTILNVTEDDCESNVC